MSQLATPAPFNHYVGLNKNSNLLLSQNNSYMTPKPKVSKKRRNMPHMNQAPMIMGSHSYNNRRSDSVNGPPGDHFNSVPNTGGRVSTKPQRVQNLVSIQTANW